MHFLLIPFALLSLLFVMQYSARQQAYARGGMLLVTVLTVALFFATMWFREPAGDSWRYLETFRNIRTMSLGTAMSYPDTDPLFVLLNWLAGRLGESSLILYGATLLVFFGVFTAAMRQMLGPLATVVVLMSYTAFPFFVAYAANGLRQGLSMVFLLMGYALLSRGQRTGWVWLLMAPLWHSGAWLAVAVTISHQLMCFVIKSTRVRWLLVMGVLGLSITLSATGLNETLMSQLPEKIELRDSQEIYFDDAEEFGYRGGFRLDFLAFSLVPLVTALMLYRRGRSFHYSGPGWWLSLYLSLNVIYQLFAFAPFSDRFAGFSWFLMPLVIFLQVQQTGWKNLQTAFVVAVCLVNVAMLQLYTGNFIRPPMGW
jgi:hypothetical protein